MNPLLVHQLAKAQIADARRQAGRERRNRRTLRTPRNLR